jgi:protein-disulfide isomerase
MKKEALVVVAAVGLLLVSLFGTLAFMSGKRGESQSAQVAERNRAHLVRMHSPTLGKEDAPVVIVEFLDPACGTCRDFYPLVKKMMAANPDRIRLVLRYAPFHQGSDKVVAALVAAGKQGKFWPALEALLAAQPQWVLNHKPQVDLIWKHLDGLGLNLEQLRADVGSADIARMIAQDLEDAVALNVSQTPEFFVNGWPLPSFGYDQLKELVDQALAAAQ